MHVTNHLFPIPIPLAPIMKIGIEGTIKMKNVLTVNDVELGHFWHCFGTERHRADKDTVVGLLEASRTRVLPINTHRLGPDQRRDALEHGFDDVSYDALSERVDTSALVKMLNTQSPDKHAGGSQSCKACPRDDR